MTAPDHMEGLVSVYMPTHNRSELLHRSITSVLNQTYSMLELIVVDDGSTDDTWDVLQKLSKQDDRIRLIKLATPLGAPAARNVAISQARGRWITGIDDDDEMHSDRLETLIKNFDEQFSLICSAQRIHFGSWSKLLRNSMMLITLENELFADEVGTQALTLTKRIREVGGFDRSMPAWQDYDLWVRLIERFGSAQRISEETYVQHMSCVTPRITDKAALGARCFYAKHGKKMSDAQRARHRLELIMLEQQPLEVSTLCQYWYPNIRAKALRYLLSSQLPVLRKISRALRENLPTGKSR